MEKSLSDKIKYLIENNIGDVGRLESIQNSINKGKPLYHSDQKYLDSIITKHFPKEAESKPETIPQPSIEENKTEEISAQKIEPNKPSEQLENKKESNPEKRITIVKDVLFHPTSAFREINQQSKFYISGGIVLFLASAGLFSEGFLEGLGSMAMDITIIGLVLYIGRGLGGKGNFSGIFSTLQYAGIPTLIASGLLLLLPDTFYENIMNLQPQEIGLFVGVLGIAIILFIWSFILSIIAVREAHQFGTGRAFGTLILSGIIFIIVFIPIVFSVGLLSEF